ncbi:unnamed protein product [Caenorhabditis angaria]|uniref:Uncharacterized protein n=1 Tax=Caenorhabditis angaria TaxID=860376 RepID=A0A9P1IQY8_9PELO|nr:unnamed protein product [Caenorhabditis angaria]
MVKKPEDIDSDFARVGVKIELADKERTFDIDSFERFVSEAIREVFGNCGPVVKVSEFNSSTLRGSIVAPGNEAKTVWAALSAKGKFQGQRIAAHLHSLTETDITNIF